MHLTSAFVCGGQRIIHDNYVAFCTHSGGQIQKLSNQKLYHCQKPLKLTHNTIPILVWAEANKLTFHLVYEVPFPEIDDNMSDITDFKINIMYKKHKLSFVLLTAILIIILIYIIMLCQN